MSRYVYIAVIALGLLVLALGGWTVQGLRRLRGPRRVRAARLAASH